MNGLRDKDLDDNGCYYLNQAGNDIVGWSGSTYYYVENGHINTTWEIYKMDIDVSAYNSDFFKEDWQSATDKNCRGVYDTELIHYAFADEYSAVYRPEAHIDNIIVSRYNVSIYHTKGLLNVLNVSVLCVENYICSLYSDCIDNVSSCLAVTDTGCNLTYYGNISDFDYACIPGSGTTPGNSTLSLTTIDLSTQTNVILFGLFLFFWLGLAALSQFFKSFIYGSLMFFIGVLLAFWSFSISWILTAMFLLFSTLLFMRSAKFK